MGARIAIVSCFVGLGLAPACGLDDDSKLDHQLDHARAATAKYRDVSLGEADGFVSTQECTSNPVLGTMGIHFVDSARMADPALAIEEPEALLYVRQDGELRLVAIEYVEAILVDGLPYMGCGVENESCPPIDPQPAPSLYEGVVFDGPMAGHSPGMPWHYDLHVWVWTHNPAGMFAMFNPALSCE